MEHFLYNRDYNKTSPGIMPGDVLYCVFRRGKPPKQNGGKKNFGMRKPP